MRRLAEALVFTAAALGLHAAALRQLPPEGGDAAGAGGTEMITLAAAPGDLDAVLDAWMAPPEAAETVTQPPTPVAEAAMAAPPQPPADAPPDRAAARRPAPPQPGTGDDAPRIDRAVPPAPVPTQAAQRPQARKAAEKPRQTRKATAPARRQTAGQKAAGRGGGAQAGTTGKASAATRTRGDQARQVSVWGARIRARIERNKRFPRGTRGSGEVRLRVRVAPSGQLVGAQVIRSSGNPAFDNAALRAVRQAGRFSRAPSELTDASYSFTFSMRFGR